MNAAVRLRARVVALVFAMVGGVGMFLVTTWHVMRQSNEPAVDIRLLGNYFPGYEVSWTGASIGFLYGAVTGAVIGWIASQIYNRIAMRRSPR